MVSWILKKYRLAIVIGLVLMTVIVACAIVNPYISGMIVDDVIQGGAYDLLPKLIGIMLAVTAVRAILRYATQMMFETCSQGCFTACVTRCTANCCRKILPFTTATGRGI